MLNIASINVLGLPTFGDIENRLINIVSLLRGYDIILLQEDFLFHSRVVQLLRGDYHIVYGDRRGSFRLINSGLSTLVKKSTARVKTSSFEAFQECEGIASGGFDCWSTKGFQVTKIELEKRIRGLPSSFNVVNLHLNSSEGASAVRHLQLLAVEDFLKRRHQVEDLIVGGDFNATGADIADFEERLNLKSSSLVDGRLDHILISKNLRGESYFSDYFRKEELSDHYLTYGYLW